MDPSKADWHRIMHDSVRLLLCVHLYGKGCARFEKLRHQIGPIEET